MDLPLNPVEASAYSAEDKWVFLFVHLLNGGFAYVEIFCSMDLLREGSALGK
jgi:hypothetical protein